VEKSEPVAAKLLNGRLWVKLQDGRVIGTPLDWYPFLDNAMPQQQANIQLKWNAIWWPDLDEGLSIEGMLWGVSPREEQAAIAADSA
jgi:Protein of unknown function (DUF2442)